MVRLPLMIRERVFTPSSMRCLFAALSICAAAACGSRLPTAPDTTGRLDGDWGGIGASLSVRGDAADLDFPCATGRIDGAIPLDGHGAFDVPGTYTPGQGAPP